MKSQLDQDPLRSLIQLPFQGLLSQYFPLLILLNEFHYSQYTDLSVRPDLLKLEGLLVVFLRWLVLLFCFHIKINYALSISYSN